ncbi:MAG: HIT family protein [Ilumatobacteraceae bacterium]
MSLDRLWSGWRADYVGSTGTGSGTGSVFTEILGSGLPDDETFIVHRGTTCFVILNAYPYSTGHMLVLPYREVADLEQLTDEESSELWATVTAAVAAVKRSHRPHALNVGINLGASAGGSISRHLHVHVVPRWEGDANFMTAVANTRTLPEPLGETHRRIRSAWTSGTSPQEGTGR